MRRFLHYGAWSLIIGCLLLFVYWKTNGQELTAAFNDAMLNRAGRFLSGHLSAERMDLSLSGSTLIHKLGVYDKNNKPVASANMITVDLNILDVLRGDFDLAKIKSVSVEGLQLHLERDPNGRWNVEDLLRPETEAPRSAFRGRVLLNQATAFILTSDQQNRFDKITGDLDFATFPEIKADLGGFLGESTLSIKGTWSDSKTLDLRIHVDEMDTAQLPASMTTLGKADFLGGKISDFTIALGREKEDVSIGVSGVLSNCAINIAGVKVTEVQGRAKYDKQLLRLDDVTMVYANQPLSVDGQVDLSAAQPRLNLKVSSSSFDLSSVAKTSPVHGKITFAAVVEGTPLALVVRGDYKIPVGTVDSVEFTDAAGNFAYQADVLNIYQTSLSSMGGKLEVSGNWNRKTGDSVQKISGANIDAAKLANGSIQGTVDIVAEVIGKEGQDLLIRGSFTSPSVTLSGRKFEKISGAFEKQGKNMELSKLTLITSDQNFNAEGKLILVADDPQLEFSLRSGGVELSAFRPDVPISGQISFQTAITGTLKNYTMEGTFELPVGKIGSVPFASGAGSFSLANDVIVLKEVRANMLGGLISTEGTIAKEGHFNQRISGQNIETALLTGGEMRGVANFTAVVAGKGSLEAALAEGKIYMETGTIGAYEFSALNIVFRKQGQRLQIPALNVKALRGFVTGTGHSEGDYLIIKFVPSSGAKVNLLGFGNRLLFGMDPLTAVIRQEIFKKLTLGEVKIKLKSLAYRE